MDVLDPRIPGDGILLGWIPCPDPGTAATIGRRAVEERLAACANILPGATSIYRWEGTVRTDPEAVLVVKTTRDRASVLTELVKSLHPYELPAISFLAVDGGSPEFLAWVAGETTPLS